VTLILLLLLPIGPRIESVDVIELNNIHAVYDSTDDYGRKTYRVNLVATYWVFWELHGDELRVRDWASPKPSDLFTNDSGKHVLVTQRERPIRIEAPVFRETWTLFDVETNDRAKWPEAKRRRIEGLRK